MIEPEQLRARQIALHKARALRENGQTREALSVLASLARRFPEFGRFYQELAQCHIQAGDAEAAQAALTRAVAINPAMPACWDMLAQLHRLRGDTRAASEAVSRLAVLQKLPRLIVVANSLFADGDLEPAEDALREYLRTAPGNAGALHLLARIRFQRGAADDARALLEPVLDQVPDFHEARHDLAMILLDLHRPDKARRHALVLLDHAPENRTYRKLLGAAALALGDHEAVAAIYGSLADEAPQNTAEVADLRLWRANALRIVGRSQEAVAEFRALLAARPGHGAAWYQLANFKTFAFDDTDRSAMQAALDAPETQSADRIYLSFALGTAEEQRGTYAEAFAQYASANALKRRELDYCRLRTTACLGALQRSFTPDFFAERASWGLETRDPIFIVGLPRSGSTLVEQVLASHSLVEGTQELTHIGRYAGAICGTDPQSGLPDNPQAIAGLSRQQIRALAERYLAETRAHRTTKAPRFIDKMPNNFWHIGLIHLMFPNATVIDVRRPPMSCCFSNFRQLFGGANQPFAYAFEDLASYYRDYLVLMRHWHSVLPQRVLRVHYEDVVSDLAGSVDQLLAHAQLAPEPACREFHRTARSIRTPSSEQVRRPINRDGMDQWLAFQPWLRPLEAALRDTLHSYRD